MKIKIAIIGVPSNIHVKRRLSLIDKNYFDIIVISPVFFEKSEYLGIKVFSLDINKFK